MAELGKQNKRKTIKARNFLSRRRGGQGGESNMAKGDSTGGGGIKETASSRDGDGRKVKLSPGAHGKQCGLGRTGSSRSQKCTASSPLFRFLKNVRIAFSPKSKLASSPLLETPLNKSGKMDESGNYIPV